MTSTMSIEPAPASAVTNAGKVLLISENLGLEARLSGFCQPVPRSTIADLSAYARGEGADTRVVITAGGTLMDEAVWDFPNLGLISVIGVGYDGIDVDRARARGIRVTNGRGANAEDVADMALGLLIAAVRRIGEGERMVRSGEWRTWIAMPTTPSVSQLRCGIVGLGAIGLAVGRRLDLGFGADVAWWGPSPKPEAPWPRADTLLALAEQSDVLIVCAPATPATRHLIDSQVLAALGPRGYLVNISRGSLVDEDALLVALRSRTIAGAGLDVYEVEPHDGSRWKDIENAIVTPHCAGGGEGAIDQIRRMCVANVAAFLAGEPLLTPLF